MGEIDECGSLIIDLYVNEGRSVAEIKDELTRKGYEIKAIDIVRFLRNAKISTKVHEGKQIAMIYLNTVEELALLIDHLKDIANKIDFSSEDDVLEKHSALVSIARLIKDMIVDLGKLTGQISNTKINIENQEINVYQLNQALNVLLVKLVDEKKIELVHPELQEIYIREKRRLYDGSEPITV